MGKGNTAIYLQTLIFWALWSLLTACGSSRLAPQWVQEDTSALPVDSLIQADASVQASIQPYKEKLDVSLDSIIGYSARELQKETVESALGNFVADLTQEAAQDKLDTAVDMGVVTIGGLRMPLPEGAIRLGDVYEVMPFENLVLVLRLTGKEVQELFEFAAERKIVAISNSKMVVRDGKPVSILINGEPLDLTKHYTIATSDYLASGGDNLVVFKNAERLKNTDILLRSAILNKISALHRQGKQVEASIEGRVEVIE
ncbi:MAG: 5'-nucleotidase C-terminal domain-containing protein [Bacteroidetes bacterium]|nr:5'-nucleotidase C-terminal domain-containing protein [Bacteroidota bacterium]